MEEKSPSNEKRPVRVVASGYFSPLHSSHIEYLKLSKEFGDYLIVVVNNDKQEILKKGKIFIECDERKKIVKALKCVDMVVEATDKDRSICETLIILQPDVFTNGGDQFNDNIPEASVCERYGIKMVDGLGDKKHSSSAIIARAKEIDNYKNKDEHVRDKKPGKRKHKQGRPNNNK